MTNDIICIIGALGGVLIGSMISYRAAIRASTYAHGHQLEAESRAAENRLRIRLNVGERRRRLEKVDDSYGRLVGWLYELEIAIDGVRIGVHSENPSVLDDLQRTVDEWPWKTLKPPRYVASTQHYWSEDTRDLLQKFYGQSSSFTLAATVALRQRTNPSLHQSDPDNADDLSPTGGNWAALGELIDEHIELRKLIVRIRDQVRQELSANGSVVENLDG